MAPLRLPEGKATPLMSVHHLPAPQTDRIDRIEERLDVIVGLLHGLINDVQALRDRMDAR